MAKMSKAAAKGEQPGQRRLSGAAVLKFGGTSVEDSAALRRVIGIVAQRDKPVVVVVSALAGVTDQLLAAGEQAASGGLAAAEETLQNILERHGRMAGDLLPQPAVGSFQCYLQSECEEAQKLL